MSIATDRGVTDHEIYRVFSFQTWESRESSPTSAQRLRRLNGELHRLGWMPQDVTLPDRREAAGWKQRLWEAEPQEIEDGWYETFDGISYPEELLVYVGLRRQESRSEEDWSDWLPSAAARWDERYPATLWGTAFASPEKDEHENRPRMLGQCWVWTGEWDSVPAGGWEAFALKEYGPGRFRLFPWGVLGFPDDPAKLPGGIPRFDLHTTNDEDTRAGRDLYLRWELPRLLTCFLKGDQFLRRRSMALRELLEVNRTRLMAKARPVGPPRTITQEVLSITERLTAFHEVLAAVEGDARSLEVALDEVRRALPTAPGSANAPWPVERLELLARQIHTDLDYGRLAVGVGDRLLEKHSIFGEIEETRATDRLSKLGIAVGGVLGAMQLTTDFNYRAAILGVGGAFCLLLLNGDALRRLRRRLFGRRRS